ncbi:MAG: CotH kinase family protein, partial [Ureaplasma sp.]|nr:CotH kinase family protein [Ureaplasma sp.]
SLEIIISPNTEANVINTTIELSVNISNIDNLSTNQKLVLSNFKSSLVPVPLPNLKNNIDINTIDSSYLDMPISKFVENNFANERNINSWLETNKSSFFNSSNDDLSTISLQIKPNTLLETNHSRDSLSFDVVFSNGIESQNDKLTLTNFKLPTPPITNPASPTPYSYTPHLDTILPRMDISINTNDPNSITDQYQSANFIVTDPNTNNVSEQLSGKIKVRGNSTSDYPKKPYRIKLDKKASMLNLNHNNKFKDWVLLADWRDPSMLRNATGLYLGQFLYKDFGLYSSDFRYVEVYINNTYQGMYLLCEQNEVSTNRVNIDKPILNSSNTDIGYLLEMDAYADSEEPLFRFDLNYNDKAKLPPEDNPDKNIFQSVGVLSYSIK